MVSVGPTCGRKRVSMPIELVEVLNELVAELEDDDCDLDEALSLAQQAREIADGDDDGDDDDDDDDDDDGEEADDEDDE